MNRLILTILLICVLGGGAAAQNSIVKDFKPVCDSLDVLVRQNRDVKGKLVLKNVMKRGNFLDFYFTESLGDYPWRKGEPETFRKNLRELFPEKYGKYSLGAIYSKRTPLEKLVTPGLGFDGKPSETEYKTKDPVRRFPLVRRAGAPEFSRGLDGRTIAIWQSHGRYFDGNTGRWIWQRPCLFQTVEDMYTQSYVLPFLVPMLENAGAYVMLPRERDTQVHEIISDHDGADMAYGSSTYEETGGWKDAGTGFAAMKPFYTGVENPFTTGTARKSGMVPAGGKKEAKAVWRPEIPERGEYAVYVSYKSIPESASAVSYKVNHLGGESEFIVNQSIGGGTWIYLGTFEFAEGNEGYVTLSNMTPEGYKHDRGSFVTADAVRFGGGMRNIARAAAGSEDEPAVSGLPRSAEGARYWMQWAGVDPAVYSQNESKSDYRDDFMSRGDWVEWISRDSDMNPSKKGGMGIPVDLSFGLHTDAGITPNDSIVGTLAIYTLRSEGSEKLPGGESRMTSREYADLVQSQIVNDLQAEFDTLWSRRCVWDRGYRESRTPSCPALLLELLSHQNFADMKYGLDPSFRFTVSRAVYKGMLKYLSNRYGVPYQVQPLPVQNMGVRFGKDGKAVISWKETEDRLEPTAKASGFRLYTRTDDGGFDTGRMIKATENADGLYSAEVAIKNGHIYSFRIAAVNDGGESFPSETVSIGMPSEPKSYDKVLIVNNFDRVSGPAFIDLPSYAGFDNRLDSGVPYIKDISFIGEMYEFRRDAGYISNEYPGFGASFDDKAGMRVAGNTFDYPYVHGRAVMNSGHPFYSCSNESFSGEDIYAGEAWAVDMICGKQVTTSVGNGQVQRFSVFPEEIRKTITEFTAAGGNVLISGANIGTDVWDSIYPVRMEKTDREDCQKFAGGILGYKWTRNSAGREGTTEVIDCEAIGSTASEVFEFHNEMNEECYCVESPDGIAPAGKSGSTFLEYGDTGISAGICHEGNGYRTVCLGFPIETLKNEEDINRIFSLTLDFFSK